MSVIKVNVFFSNDHLSPGSAIFNKILALLHINYYVLLCIDV